MSNHRLKPEYFDSLIGNDYGRWTVIGWDRVLGRDKRSPHVYVTVLKCSCSCGVEKLMSPSTLRNAQSLMCDKCRRINDTKPGRQSNAYVSWQAMKARCGNTNNPAYGRYGGRGVTYCDRWKSFDNFYEDMGERPDGYELDKDKKGGIGCKLYCPENCCWLTSEDNNKFRRPDPSKDSTKLTPEQCNRILQLNEEGHSGYSIRQITGHGFSAIKNVISLNRTRY